MVNRADFTSSISQIGAWFVGRSRTFKRVMLVSNDVILLSIAVWLSFSLRLAQPYVPPNATLAFVVGSAPFIGVVVFYFLGLYRLVTRFLGYRGAVRIFWGVSLATLIWAVLLLMAVGKGDPEIWVPRSVVLSFPVIGGFLAWASRQVAAYLLVTGLPAKAEQPNRTPVLIYGAGAEGVKLLEALRDSPDHEVVGFLDDVPNLIGQHVGGLKVYRVGKLARFVERACVKEVLLALPRRQRSERREIIRRLAKHPVRVKTMPALEDIATGRVSVSDLRPIDVDDLLTRDVVPPDAQLLARSISGKSVMVTGAGGTIGSELVRQILRQAPTRLVLLELSEAALYEVETEIRDALASHDEQGGETPTAPTGRPEIVAVLGSVNDARLLEQTMRINKVETIYHAAAYKHVPIVEANPIAGLRNNTFGTLALSKMAVRAGVERVVLVSTDKAVRPTNIMGASKRLAEMIFQAAASLDSKTVFTMVRFGNVLDSSGSVVRRFRRQIQEGGPVTVTHRDVIRYFMSIPEAATLVIQAGAMASGGDLFVLDMGEPVRIDDLARTMIRMAGLEVRSETNPLGDIAIRYIGLRPGEKLFEELLLDGERITETEHPRIHQSQEPFLAPHVLQRELAKLEAAMQLEMGSREAIQEVLERTVEGYRPAQETGETFAAVATWSPASRTLH